MSARQRDWAARKRLSMCQLLGGKCLHCGVTTNLSFDCIKPTRDGHARLDSVRRVSYYLRQMRAGNLQLLCSRCNSVKRDLEAPRYQPTLSCVKLGLTVGPVDENR